MGDAEVFSLPDFVRLIDWASRSYDDDVPFYRGLAGRVGPPILELGCGTGRLTIPLARAGFEVVGVDLSAAMLQRARAHLGEEPPEVRDRITLLQADMRELDLGREFAAVLVPNAGVFHLPGRYSLTQCCRALFQHTRPGGVAVLDAPAPAEISEHALDKQRCALEGVNPDTGLLTRELLRFTGMAWDRQIARVELVFTEGEVEEQRRHTFEQDYRWLERDEGVALLERAGFPVVDVFGDFEEGAYGPDSPRLILVAHRLERDLV